MIYCIFFCISVFSGYVWQLSEAESVVLLTTVAGINELTYIENFVASWKTNSQSLHVSFFVTSKTAFHVQAYLENLSNSEIVQMNGSTEMPLMSYRFLAYRQYLKLHQHQFTHVLLADCRDLIIQGNLFTALDIDKAAVYASLEGNGIGKAIGTCPRNTEWIRDCFGNPTFELLKYSPITCAGTILGGVLGIINYIDAMEPLLQKRCNDQGVHNYLTHTKANNLSVKVLTNEESPILTCGYYNMNNTYFNHGLLYRSNGKLPAIVHQYDRSHHATQMFKSIYARKKSDDETENTEEQTCAVSCCWRLRPATWIPYNGNDHHNVTRHDLLSPKNNKFLGDLVYGSITRPPDQQLPVFHEDMIDCLQHSTVIFIEGGDIKKFVENIFPRIKVGIVVVSGDTDEAAPGKYLQMLTDERILHWFAMNCDVHADRVAKVTCLPLGISQWQVGGLNSLQEIEKALISGLGLRSGILPSKQAKLQDKLMLSAFDVRSNIAKRGPLWKEACTTNGTLRQLTTCGHFSGASYYKALAEHCFVLAPEGVGLDTYRTWEALYMGSYPIVVSSTLNTQYHGLPVLVVQSFFELNETVLRETCQVYQSQTWNYAKLYLGYYFDAVNAYRNGYDKRYRIDYVRR